MDEPLTVPTTKAALGQLGLPDHKRITELNPAEMAAFRKLIGWDQGGPVVAYPSDEEQSTRADRERWKSERAGKGATAPCLWMDADQITCFKQNLETDADTRRWWADVLRNAEALVELPLIRIGELVPDQGPWTFAGSFCPNCVGEKSPVTQHAGFWNWSALDPDKLTCPYCHISYPHPDYPETGCLSLPRLGLTYSFHITSRERQSGDWRDGAAASNFAGIPTHVSFLGEIRTIKLAWCVGQIEPLSVVYAVTGDTRYADIVGTILSRLADVYARYPVFSYGQEYVDAEPAYAIEHVGEMPTPFRRAASLGTYTGTYGGQMGNRGMDRTTPATSYYTNAEWGSSRLGREKASNGQLFLSLFKGYDLVKQTISARERLRIERDFMLELYLDTRGLSTRVNNKSGPGAASRVAVGIFYDDREALDEGLAQFHEILKNQFYEDGSWKETPIYGAKSMNEGMSEIPEMLRGRTDLYTDSLYRQAFESYAELATPLDTQPAIGDSTADFRLQPILVDIARIRLGLPMSYGPASMAGFGVRSPFEIGANSGYTPSLNGIPSEGSRLGIDGPIGFGTVGHIPRSVSQPSWISMFNERRPSETAPNRPAVNRYYHERNLACLGFGEGDQAAQLYCDGGDGRGQHRHHAPLSMLLFAGGREVFPDQGYIGDHPANAWIKSTPSHNTVIIDEKPAGAPTRTVLKGFNGTGPVRFVDLETDVPGPEGVPFSTLRRVLAVLERPDGLPVLVDVLDVVGGSTHDYVVRVNDPEDRFEIGDFKLSDRQSLFPGVAQPGPHRFRTVGQIRDPFIVRWGRSQNVWAHVLSAPDECITFRSPAWRDRKEAFAEPDRSWDALVLRKNGGQNRFIVVYDVGGRDGWIQTAQLTDRVSNLEIQLQTQDEGIILDIGEGTIALR